jgi:disulfide bond formation protein DsbB
MTRRWLIVVAALTLALAACGGDDDDAGNGAEPTSGAAATAAPVAAGDADTGKSLYDGTCVACHADGGTGIDGLGKALAGSEFVNGLDDAGLVAFLKVGRPASDPENTTGVDMAPKGGNPSLTDDDLTDIVAYLRTLN